jgi:hypothetical protein
MVVVVMFVAILGVLGMWYVAYSDITRFQDAASDATAETKEIEGRFDGMLQGHQDLSVLVGFNDPSNPTSKSDVVALQAEIDSIKATLGTAAGSATTLQGVTGVLRQTYQSNISALNQAKADFSRELAARQAAESAINATQSTLQAEIASLNQQLSDEQQRSANQSTSDQDRIDDLTTQQQAADATARQAQQSLADLQVDARRSKATADATIKTLAIRREVLEPEAPDGEVLSVGAGGTVAFIDIGGESGLKRGTRFEVLRPGKAGILTARGSVEVRDVLDGMAMVGLVGAPDPYDPMLPGDLVRNPHFEKGRVLRYYLLGDFPLTLSKDFVTGRLVDLGAEVDETLSTTTDVLVLGEKNLAEGEFAVELTDTEEFKLADKLGMRIVRLDELAGFLRY